MTVAAAPRATRTLRRAKGIKLKDLNVGDEFEGTVSRVSTIGVWVDIGAEKQALYPKSELDKEKSAYKPGDKIPNLKITEVPGDTPATRWIRVTTRMLAATVPVGETFQAKVVRATAFGVFVDIGATTDPLLPKTLFRGAILEEGDEVTVEVLSVKGELITVGLPTLKVGDTLSGRISTVHRHLGLFINIGLSREALFRTKYLEKPLGYYEPGDHIEGLRVASVNVETQKVEVCQRRLAQDLSQGDVLEGTVGGVMGFGVFFDAGLAVDVLAPNRLLREQKSEYTRGSVADLTVVKVDGNRVTVTDKPVTGTPLEDLVPGAPVKQGKVVRVTEGRTYIDIGAVDEAFLACPPADLEVGDVITDLVITHVDATEWKVDVHMAGRQALGDISIGTVVDGTVMRVHNPGLFIDVGATHAALFPYSLLPKPIRKYKVGDKIKRLRVCEADVEEGRLAVFARRMVAEFAVGDRVDGRVIRIMACSILVDIGASAKALVPQRLLGDYSVGDKIEGFRVVSVNIEEEHIDLCPGRLTGTVTEVMDSGVLFDAGLGRDVLAPNRRLREKKSVYMTGSVADLTVVKVKGDRVIVSDMSLPRPPTCGGVAT